MRRPKIVITRAISLLRPMTGSSFSWRASSVMSRPTLSSRGVPLAGCCAFCGSSCSSCKMSRRSNTCSKLCCNSTISTPILRKIITAFVFFCTSKLYTRCSVPRCVWPNSCTICQLMRSVNFAESEKSWAPFPPIAIILGTVATACRTCSSVTSACAITTLASARGCSIMPRKICSVPIYGLPCSRAISSALRKLWCACRVKRGANS